eukprot:jgi/Botrbrau1/15174/Bobra.0149s0039.1
MFQLKFLFSHINLCSVPVHRLGYLSDTSSSVPVLAHHLVLCICTPSFVNILIHQIVFCTRTLSCISAVPHELLFQCQHFILCLHTHTSIWAPTLKNQLLFVHFHSIIVFVPLRAYSRFALLYSDLNLSLCSPRHQLAFLKPAYQLVCFLQTQPKLVLPIQIYNSLLLCSVSNCSSCDPRINSHSRTIVSACVFL